MTLSLLLVSLLSASPEPQLRSGDIVLQASKSSQSAAIRAATNSRYSHVGVIEVAEDGVFVIEAIEPVSRTPWKKWRTRGIGGKVTVLRHPEVEETKAARIVAAARRHLGQPYDWYFGWDDDAIYCSELVHKAFARGAGLQVGKLEPLSALRLDLVKAAATERYGAIPMELEVVTPASIARDPALQTVLTTFD